MVDKIFNYLIFQIDKKINENYVGYNEKESIYKILSSDIIMDIISNLIVKFNEKISTNFEELIKEMLFETFKSKNIYLLNKYIELENYMKINKFDYRNNIILFNDSFIK